MELNIKNSHISIDERVYRLREHNKALQEQHFDQNDDHATTVSSEYHSLIQRDSWDDFNDFDWEHNIYKIARSAVCLRHKNDMIEKYQYFTRSIIIQPTAFCNINCSYCYLPYRTAKERLTMQTLARICKLLFSSSLLAEHILIIWHAGEPMVLPMDFYEGAFQVIKDHNVHDIQITHCFQTNGTLITQEWCEFIQRHRISLGVSLDGPQYLHDLNRVDRAGHGTFERALRGVRLLLANQITPAVIMVLTRDALAEPQEVLRFFQQEELFRVGFNAEEVEGVNLRSSLETEADIAQFQHFFEQALLWNEHTSRPLTIRETASMGKRFFFPTEPKHFSENQPFIHLNFDCVGNISTFSPELLTVTHPHYGKLTFGNVFELQTLDAIWEHPTFRQVHDDIQRGVQRCREKCDYFLLCGGGAPSNKLHEHGTFDVMETTNCRLITKAVANAVLDYQEMRHGLSNINSEEGL